jgi:hypothetical protein
MDILKKQLSGKSLVNCSSSGWANNYKGTDKVKIQSNAKSAAERHDSFNHGIETNLERLVEIGKLCEQRNIALVVVTLPVSKDYRLAMDNKKWIKTKIMLESFASASENVHYMDWLDRKDFSLEDFHDPDHLNHVGAKKVSKLLDNYLMLKHD